MNRRELLLRTLQEAECRRLVRLHLPATAGELLRLAEIRRRCPQLLREFYAMTNGLEADGLELWPLDGSLAARDRADGAIPIGRLCGRGELYLGGRGEVQCGAGEDALRWKDLAAFLAEIL